MGSGVLIVLGETVRARPRLPTRDSHGDSAGAPRRAGQRSPDHERPRATARPRPMAVGPHAGFVMPGCAACPCAAPGAGPRDAACGVCQQPGGGRGCITITSRLIIRFHGSRGPTTYSRARPDTEPPAAGNRGLLVSPLVASCNRGQSNVSSHTSYDYVQIYALSSRATSHPHLPRLGPSALPWRCVAMRARPRVAA